MSWTADGLSLIEAADPVGLAAALRAEPGVEDAVPGPGTVFVRGELPPVLPPPRPLPPPRDHAIAVRYDGEDLADLGPDAVRLHSAGTYTVGLLGFAPGFAYLHGLDPALRRPRRATPRPRIPPLAVAVAEDLTAIYPGGTPGGWHLLGTAVGITLYDRRRALLAPGDRVRFFPVDREDTPVRTTGKPAVTLLRPGLRDALVGAATAGLAHLGVPRDAPLDPAALARANVLVGNDPAMPGLECVLRGPVLGSQRMLHVGVVGVGVERTLSGFEVDCGSSGDGLRCWVAVRRGVRDLRADGFDLDAEPGPLAIAEASTGPVRLHPGPQPLAWEALLDRDFSVGVHSDRTGLRLEGVPLPDAGPAVVQGVAPGMVQVTPDGRAVLFLAGAPATGGYPVAGWVPWSDQVRLAQVRPGEVVRFTGPGDA